MRVPCDVDEIVLDGDTGNSIPSVRVTCSRCDHSEECYGTSDRSIRRALVMLRENCPEDESNFYIVGDGEDEDE